jgi:hypothetical protein
MLPLLKTGEYLYKSFSYLMSECTRCGRRGFRRYLDSNQLGERAVPFRTERPSQVLITGSLALHIAPDISDRDQLHEPHPIGTPQPSIKDAHLRQQQPRRLWLGLDISTHSMSRENRLPPSTSRPLLSLNPPASTHLHLRYSSILFRHYSFAIMQKNEELDVEVIPSLSSSNIGEPLQETVVGTVQLVYHNETVLIPTPSPDPKGKSVFCVFS